MVQVVLLNILGILLVLSPIILLLIIGPETSPRRLIYGITGLTTASIIGGILYSISLDTAIQWQSQWQGRLARELFAALVEEIIRYPGILIAQYLAIKFLTSNQSTDEEIVAESRYVEGDFTTIIDPHGMGMFFGVGYGMGEAFAFYIIPTIMEIIHGDATFIVAEESTRILLRVTAVMAHIALTYLAMAITSQRGFWRLTILLHMSSNGANRIFTELAPNLTSTIVFGVFTRFAIVFTVYFLLRPKIRYLSPAVLIFFLVVVFLLVILISTFVALFVGFISAGIFRPIGG